MRKLSLVFIVLVALLAACGDTVEVTKVVEVTKLVEVTRLVVVTATAAPTNTPVPATTTTIATTAAVSADVPANFGKELVGQTGEYQGLKAVITGVDAFPQILYNNKAIQSQGIFLVVLLDVENTSNKPASIIFINITDSKGRKFTTSSNTDAAFGLAFSGKYKADIQIQPSFKGKDYKLFEVPVDATGLKVSFNY